MRAAGCGSCTGPNSPIIRSLFHEKCQPLLRLLMSPHEDAMIFGISPGLGAAGTARRGTAKNAVLPVGRPLRILIVTDAWTPQVNGVVRTLENLGRELTATGQQVRFVT